MTWAAVAVVLTAFAGQVFWIGRMLSNLRDDIRDLKADLGARLDRIEDRLETTVLRDHGDRIARLEERIR